MNDKDYDLLQEGQDWTVISYNVHTGSWQKLVTFYADSWGDYTKVSALEYISQRKLFTNELASMLLQVSN